jgi:hypothetical protein
MEDIKDDDTEKDPSSKASIDLTANPSQEDVEMGKPDLVKNTQSSHWRKWVIAGIFLAIIGLSVGLGLGLKGSNEKTVSSSVPSNEQDVEPQQEQQPEQQEEQQHYVDYSCEQDSDCVVMNVGNCCGYYPECLHKSSTPDPSNGCEFGGSTTSVCGFPSIEKCVCDLEQLGGKCQASQE